MPRPAWAAGALWAMTAVTVIEPKVRHGRREERMLWALADPALNARAGEAGTHAAPWPYLARGTPWVLPGRAAAG